MKRLLLFINVIVSIGCTPPVSEPLATATPVAATNAPLIKVVTPTPISGYPPASSNEIDPYPAADSAEPTLPTAYPPPSAAEPGPPSAPDDETAVSTAADADVVFVRAVEAADGTWTFHVTVAHPDTGWEDYADGWDVVTPDGTILKASENEPFTRLLLHPHENEQPFTRSQGRLTIPAGVTTVLVRAHDLVDGWGGKTVTVDLTQSQGVDFVIERSGS